MLRKYVVTLQNGSTCEIDALSMRHAKAVANEKFPESKSIKQKGSGRKSEAAYVTPNLYLDQVEASALMRLQSVSGESISGLLKRLLIEAMERLKIDHSSEESNHSKLE